MHDPQLAEGMRGILELHNGRLKISYETLLPPREIPKFVRHAPSADAR